MEGVMTRHFNFAFSVCLIALCFFAVERGSAQLNTADILGTITDAAGAVIPGAKVTVQNLATYRACRCDGRCGPDFCRLCVSAPETGKGTSPKVYHFQLRPDPACKLSGAEQQSQRNHEKIVWLPDLPHP